MSPCSVAGCECMGRGHRTAQRAYIASLVSDCAENIRVLLEEQGPLTYAEIRRALRMEQHVAQAIIDKAFAQLLAQGSMVEQPHADARARQGGCPALYRLVVQ